MNNPTAYGMAHSQITYSRQTPYSVLLQNVLDYFYLIYVDVPKAPISGLYAACMPGLRGGLEMLNLFVN